MKTENAMAVFDHQLHVVYSDLSEHIFSRGPE